MQSWITHSEDKLALNVYPHVSQMYIHTKLDQNIFCFLTLYKITFLIFWVTSPKTFFFSYFLAELGHSDHVFNLHSNSGKYRNYIIYIY